MKIRVIDFLPPSSGGRLDSGIRWYKIRQYKITYSIPITIII